MRYGPAPPVDSRPRDGAVAADAGHLTADMFDPSFPINSNIFDPLPSVNSNSGPEQFFAQSDRAPVAAAAAVEPSSHNPDGLGVCVFCLKIDGEHRAPTSCGSCNLFWCDRGECVREHECLGGVHSNYVSVYNLWAQRLMAYLARRPTAAGPEAVSRRKLDWARFLCRCYLAPIPEHAPEFSESFIVACGWHGPPLPNLFSVMREWCMDLAMRLQRQDEWRADATAQLHQLRSNLGLDPMDFGIGGDVDTLVGLVSVMSTAYRRHQAVGRDRRRDDVIQRGLNAAHERPSAPNRTLAPDRIVPLRLNHQGPAIGQVRLISLPRQAPRLDREWNDVEELFDTVEFVVETAATGENDVDDDDDNDDSPMQDVD